MDLLSEIAKKLGFKYRVQLVKDSAYGRQDDSGNWNGMVGEVVRGVSRLVSTGIQWQQSIRSLSLSHQAGIGDLQLMHLK